jgi:thiamine-monophosphate kinase
LSPHALGMRVSYIPDLMAWFAGLGTTSRRVTSMKISEIGEFGLIERIAARLPSYRADVRAAIGDDLAVLGWDVETYQLATCDIQVEGAHFLMDTITAAQLGRRVAAINLSDIAAKGGTPEHFLVSLALRPDMEVEWLEQLYDGLGEEASRYGADIVGGNVSRTEGPLIVDVFLLGRVRQEEVLLRSGAGVGDLVLVTGWLGDATAGRVLLEGEVSGMDAGEGRRLVDAHLTPTPRIKEGRIVCESRRATSMIDLSDGLASDVGHICDQSGVGVRLWADRLPVSEGARKVFRHLRREDWELALGGGEDYELCFTVPSRAHRDLAEAVERETGTQVTCVGEVLEERAGRWLVLPDGRETALESLGWDHFGGRRQGD